MMNLPTLHKACSDINAVMATYVIFQIISALILSCLLSYARIKWILLMLSFFLFIGNVLFTHAVTSSLFLLFVGRAMAGIAGSVLIIGYAQVALCGNLLN